MTMKPWNKSLKLNTEAEVNPSITEYTFKQENGNAVLLLIGHGKQNRYHSKLTLLSKLDP